MKLSVEAKVAAAVAAGFIALTAGAIGQAGSGGQTGGPNNYNPTNNPGANTDMSQPTDNSSLPGRTNAEENMQRGLRARCHRCDLKKRNKEQNWKVAKTSHERTGPTEPMNRERGGELSFTCAYRRRDSAIACLPNERA
jgi:hypothetical protein